MRILIVFLLAVATVDVAEARIFGRRRARPSYTYVNQVSISGTTQEIAQQKAQIQANRGACFHPGGSFGTGYAEGVGAGMSAAAALGNCCWFAGRIHGQAAVQGANGMWYACKIYGH